MRTSWLTAWVAVLLAVTVRGDLVVPPPIVVNKPIPDGNPSGLASSQALSGYSAFSLTQVEVTLEISGGFNGDLYGYLWHQSPDQHVAVAVLINRLGRTAIDPIGYPDAGLDITIADGAPVELHVYGGTGGGPLTGSWAPDARIESPFAVTDQSPRSAYLSAFNGMSPDGLWVLYMGDVASGDESTLLRWGLRLEMVPEPRGLAMVTGLGLLILVVNRIARRKTSP